MNTMPENFGSKCFGEKEMKARLSARTLEALRRIAEEGETLDAAVAEEVAVAMRDWAVEHGATHYTHWFQPLNGFTAEKHESFVMPNGEGGAIMEFSGKALIKGESDASSFPSGGLRATFEARGYTAWDPTSFAFLKDGVLCIPTAFCSYGGEALDKKTPLLRSADALNAACRKLLALFGRERKHVWSAVGDEQEYFLIDLENYNQRKDLIYTGRTLFGAKPPKTQEISAHYYGTIPPRVAAFMTELNQELWALGIPAKTEHNEAAPAQHELAPVYEKCIQAVDHNQLMMDRMRVIARRHGFVCLLHEKPFAGVSGSGKHNNWSLMTDEGENLFNPGVTEEDRNCFLAFFLAFIAAVDEYQELLRASVADCGNDHRLGGSEAPPAVLSVYVGEELEYILSAVEKGEMVTPLQEEGLVTGATALPIIPKDTSDRNRTSPIAFTGNKFEFRMPGASQSMADCNTVLNTIVADVVERMVEELRGAGSFETALHALLARMVKEHKRILFSGNGYDSAWLEEAERRGLANLPSTAEALPHLTDEKNRKLFARRGVMSPGELRAYRDIQLESYSKRVNLEAQVMTEMVRTDLFPAVVSFENLLAETVQRKQAVDCDAKTEKQQLDRISVLVKEMLSRNTELERTLETLPEVNAAELALYYRHTVVTAMQALREVADELETLVGKKFWPFPSYGRLLYCG